MVVDIDCHTSLTIFNVSISLVYLVSSINKTWRICRRLYDTSQDSSHKNLPRTIYLPVRILPWTHHILYPRSRSITLSEPYLSFLFVTIMVTNSTPSSVPCLWTHEWQRFTTRVGNCLEESKSGVPSVRRLDSLWTQVSWKIFSRWPFIFFT